MRAVLLFRDRPMSPAFSPTLYAIPHDLPLDCGQSLAGAEIAYETYGELSEDRSNAILICHALTGDQYVASEHPLTGKPGWWERMVGPGRGPGWNFIELDVARNGFMTDPDRVTECFASL